MAIHRRRDVYYSPDDPVDQVLVALPDQGTASIDVEAYGFTHPTLVNALIAAKVRGVRVRVMNDRSQSQGASDRAALQRLVDAGVAVKVVESTRGGIDHLKNIIVDGDLGAMDDGSFVGYGSFNFSLGAESQDNVFVVDNDPGVVAEAVAKFAEDWAQNKQDAAWQIAPSASPPSVTVAVAGVPPEAVAVTVAPPAAP